jgi:hypothetical protein
MVSCSCSTRGTRRVSLDTNPVISHECLCCLIFGLLCRVISTIICIFVLWLLAIIVSVLRLAALIYSVCSEYFYMMSQKGTIIRKPYAEDQRLSNTNPTKNLSWLITGFVTRLTSGAGTAYYIYMISHDLLMAMV